MKVEKKKISDALIGYKHSDESRQKISDSRIGSKHSDKTKKIMSEVKKRKESYRGN
jgi:hypothetical protein